MGTNEFANQQPTQNLVGGGGRGTSYTAHNTGGKVRRQHPASLSLSARAAPAKGWNLK